jgi:hypothetical protein
MLKEKWNLFSNHNCFEICDRIIYRVKEKRDRFSLRFILSQEILLGLNNK